jgi:hypothetical protein
VRNRPQLCGRIKLDVALALLQLVLACGVFAAVFALSGHSRHSGISIPAWGFLEHHGCVWGWGSNVKIGADCGGGDWAGAR